MADINYNPNAVLEALNDKMDRDMGNASQYALIGIAAAELGLPKVNHDAGQWLYGVSIDTSMSDPYNAVQYIPGCDNMFYAPAKMMFSEDRFYYGSWEDAPFMPSPCMLLKSGAVDYYLNPNDYTKKLDGTNSDVANRSYNGNAMMEWNTIYQHKYQNGGKIYWLFSNAKLTNDFECWSTKKEDNSYASHFYTPCYEGSNISNVLRSLSTGAKPTPSLNSDTENTYARANGPGWDITCQADEDLIIGLTILMFKTLDLQTALGYGATASSSALTVNCGVNNTKGLFYGTAAASASGIKLFGMEQWYAHRWRRVNGLMMLNGYYYVKMTKGTQDGSTVNNYVNVTDGYIATGIKAPSANQSYIKTMAVTPWGLLPTEVGGSSKTYYCDGMWSNLSGTIKGLRGGSAYDGLVAGLFALNVNHAPSASNWHFGASLSYHL